MSSTSRRSRSQPADQPVVPDATSVLSDRVTQFQQELVNSGASEEMLNRFRDVVGLSRGTGIGGPDFANMQAQVTALTQELSHVRSQLSLQQTTTTTTSSALHHTKIKVEKPKNFDGTPSKFKTWVFELKQYFEIVQLTNTHDQAAFTVTLFSGRASSWWRMHSQNVKIGTFTLEELLTEMECAFSDEDRERKLITAYENIRQTGDVYQYVNKFKTLLFELNHDIPDSFKINRFITGLKYDIKKAVLTNTNITTLSDAVLAAERAQATLDFLRTDNTKFLTNKKQFPSRKFQPRDESVPMELGHSKKVHNVSRKPGTAHSQSYRQTNYHRPNNTPNTKNDLECYYCGKKGHIKRNCFKWQNSMSQNRHVNFVHQNGDSTQYIHHDREATQPQNGIRSPYPQAPHTSKN